MNTWAWFMPVAGGQVEGKTLEMGAARSLRPMKWVRMLPRMVLGSCLAMVGLVAHAGVSPTAHGLRMGAYRVERDVTPGRNKVVGTLTNRGHARVHTVRVSFRLLDAKGRVIGRAYDAVHDLQPGQTWKFHANARGNVSHARLIGVVAE
jgi:hypothetical protein